jgi:hypothetical protein
VVKSRWETRKNIGYLAETTQGFAALIKLETGQNTVPPFSYMTVAFNASTVTWHVPFQGSAKSQNQCGKTRNEIVSGVALISGVPVTTQASFDKDIGPAVPVECTKPIGLPPSSQRDKDWCPTNSTLCRDNAMCARLGFDGVCCTPGSMKPCCAQAEAHAACSGYAPSDTLCPSARGTFAECCGLDNAGRLLLPATPTKNLTVSVHAWVDYLTPEEAASRLEASRPAKGAESAITTPAKACEYLPAARFPVYTGGKSCAVSTPAATEPTSSGPNPALVAAGVAGASFTVICAVLVLRQRRRSAHKPCAELAATRTLTI